MVARLTELKEMCTFHKLQHECDAVVHAAVLMLKCYIVQPYIKMRGSTKHGNKNSVILCSC